MRFFLLSILFFLAVSGLHGEEIADNDLFRSIVWNLHPNALWQRKEGVRNLKVQIPHSQNLPNETFGASADLDLKKYRGKSVVFSVQLKGEDIPVGKNRACCAKLMLCLKDPTGVKYETSGFRIWGTFDWKTFELPCTIPEECSQLTLMVGIQSNSGTLYARSLKVVEKDMFPAPVPLPKNFRCEYTSYYRSLPKLRGVNGGSLEDNAALAGRWKFNLVRYWIPYGDRDAALPGLKKELESLKQKLPGYRKQGVRLILTFPTPGGRYQTPVVLGTAGSLAGKSNEGMNFRVFQEQLWLEAFLRAWRMTAEMFKDSPEIIGYDLMNEPTQLGKVRNDYLMVQYLAAKEIRKIDPERLIVISSNDWSNSASFRYLKPVPLKNVLYQVHFYNPGEYTHQGVSAESMERLKKGGFVRYPGMINGVYYDKNRLREVLAPVRAFQKKYGAEIFCGEFAVINWAPGGAKYLDDILSILEEYGWMWCFLGTSQSWYGFNPECKFDIYRRTIKRTTTDQLEVLLRYFAKNPESAL